MHLFLQAWDFGDYFGKLTAKTAGQSSQFVQAVGIEAIVFGMPLSNCHPNFNMTCSAKSFADPNPFAISN